MNNWKHAFRMVLGIIGVVGGLVALAGLYFMEIPAANKEPLMLAIGVILGWGGQVFAYEFGSSTGSKEKTELLGK